MAEGDGTNGSAAAKAGAATETKDAPPAAETKDAPAPAVDEADVLEEDDDFEEFEEDRTFFFAARAFGTGRPVVQTVQDAGGWLTAKLSAVTAALSAAAHPPACTGRVSVTLPHQTIRLHIR